MIRPPALLFGVPIDDVTLEEAIETIHTLVEIGRTTGRRHQVATVNVDFLVNALADPDVARILQQADLCVADGMPIVWATRLLGMGVRERVAGADLVPRLIEASQRTRIHVHVFGSAPDVADRARSLLRDRYPAANFSIDPGPMIADPAEVDDEVLDSIAAIDPDVLCVALGNPKQERFIAAHRDRLGTPVMIGVGGSLDLLTGKRRRAPTWVQRIGLEWIVRALQEPGRLGRRYAHDLRVFGPAVASELRANRGRRHGHGLGVHIGDSQVEARLATGASSSTEELGAALARLGAGSTLVIGADPGSTVEDTATAGLVGLVRASRRSGSTVAWTTSPRELVPGFVAMRLSPDLLGLDPTWGPGRSSW